jgi:uncharacterized protein YjiS (DUF1127 family)
MSGRAMLGAPHVAAGPVGSALASAWATASSALSGFTTCMMTVRMASVLSQLSDAQLARIGIERHEIFSHAEKLISGAKKS